MTKEFEQTVRAFVNLNQKIDRAIDNVDESNLEKLKTASVLLKPLAKHRDEAKEKILAKYKEELFTAEEKDWFLKMIEPYMPFLPLIGVENDD